MRRRIIQTLALATALVCVNATAGLAQPYNSADKGTWYGSGAFLLWSSGGDHQDGGCNGASIVGQGGALCRSIARTGWGGLVNVGGALSDHVAIEVEAVVGLARRGDVTYQLYAGHFGNNKTTGDLRHSEKMFSGLMRFMPSGGNAGVRVEPVVGFTMAFSDDTLTNQSRQDWDSSTGTTSVQSSPGDLATKTTAFGFTAGLDVVVPIGRGVSVVASGRVRWIDWPREHPDASPLPNSVPVSVGRTSIQVGAGLRWGR